MNPYAVCWALAAYLYNHSPDELARQLFPGRHPDYLGEWTFRFSKGFAFAIGKMSEDTLKRFVDLALAGHGAAAAFTFPNE